jgi:hypothetical protein
MGVYGSDDIEQAGDDDETGSVVGSGDLNGVSAEAELATDQVKESAAEVAGEAEHVKNVLGAGEELALHGEAEDEHAADGDQEQAAAEPFALNEVTRTGNEPAGQQRSILEALRLGFGSWCGLRGGCRHFFLILH